MTSRLDPHTCSLHTERQGHLAKRQACLALPWVYLDHTRILCIINMVTQSLTTWGDRIADR